MVRDRSLNALSGKTEDPYKTRLELFDLLPEAPWFIEAL